MNYIPQNIKSSLNLLLKRLGVSSQSLVSKATYFLVDYELEQLLLEVKAPARHLLCLMLQFDACMFRCKKLHL